MTLPSLSLLTDRLGFAALLVRDFLAFAVMAFAPFALAVCIIGGST